MKDNRDFRRAENQRRDKICATRQKNTHNRSKKRKEKKEATMRKSENEGERK
jgi:hypothetical protein